MASLPTVFGDVNTWAPKLINWLLVAHNTDGTEINGGAAGIPQGGPLTQDLDANGFNIINVGDISVASFPGTTAASRFVGGMISGAPTTGTFQQNDFVIDRTGAVYVCITAGSPGIWVRSNRRTGTVASSATPAINTDAVDYFSITALSVAITSMTSGLTGTPFDGQKLDISMLDNGSARAITWGTKFEASSIALPTTTTISTRKDMSFIYNGISSKWRIILAA